MAQIKPRCEAHVLVINVRRWTKSSDVLRTLARPKITCRCRRNAKTYVCKFIAWKKSSVLHMIKLEGYMQMPPKLSIHRIPAINLMPTNASDYMCDTLAVTSIVHHTSCWLSQCKYAHDES